jgi:hypothetical protein
MARLISEQRSTTTHVNMANRHCRLCKQNKGADEWIVRITPFIDSLKQREAQTMAAREEKDAAYDNVILKDSLLDDMVRTLFERCNQHKRQNPGDNIVQLLFPNGTFGDVVSVPLYSEADVVEKIVSRLEDLGSDHPLADLVAPLRTAIQSDRDALGVHKTAITEWKSTEAEEEMAKAALRRQYEHNYLDAVKQFGKRYAERLFPKTGRSRPTLAPETTPEPESI